MRNSFLAGTYDSKVRLDADNELALTIGDLGLAGSTNYRVFATGLAGDVSLTALPVVDTP